MNNKNEINRAPAPQKTIPFRVSDNEMYMIRENSIKRIHDVMKNSYNAKPNPDCNLVLKKEIEQNNEKFLNSMKSTINIFENVFEIDEIKAHLDNKLEQKFQECQAHIAKTMKQEELQKSLGASLNYLRKKSNQ